MSFDKEDIRDNKRRLIFFFFDLLKQAYSRDIYDPKIRYSKTYFAKNYYKVDIETFNKWLEYFTIYNASDFCRRTIGESEWNVIIDSLGYCDGKDLVTIGKLDLVNLLELHNKKYGINQAKKLLDEMICNHYNLESCDLRKFPPRVASELLFLELGLRIREPSTRTYIPSKQAIARYMLSKAKEHEKISYQELISSKWPEVVDWFNSIDDDYELVEQE